MAKVNHAQREMDHDELPVPVQQDSRGFSEAEPIDDYNDLQMKVANLHFNESDQDHLFVSERLFKAICKRTKAENRSIMFGDPGVRLYVPGVKEELDRLENMSAEAYGEYVGKKRNEEKRPR
jgi:hypothetical protein